MEASQSDPRLVQISPEDIEASSSLFSKMVIFGVFSNARSIMTMTQTWNLQLKPNPGLDESVRELLP
ncbi:hypothetical protein N7490_010025 [Penicillium lividum]|nr:hypothetical protein N7490_010025 [Penicillium lividum]